MNGAVPFAKSVGSSSNTAPSLLNVVTRQQTGGLMLSEPDKYAENALAIARWQEYQESGETAINEAMLDWLDSWGTSEEKPCPVK